VPLASKTPIGRLMRPRNGLPPQSWASRRQALAASFTVAIRSYCRILE
jgi:hypothetical protein